MRPEILSRSSSFRRDQECTHSSKVARRVALSLYGFKIQAGTVFMDLSVHAVESEDKNIM